MLTSSPQGFPKAVETTHSNYLSQLMLLDDSEMLNFGTESNNVSIHSKETMLSVEI